MATHKSAPQTQISADGDDEPQDMEAFRWRMVRRINTFLGTWRACRRPACKRAQRCLAMRTACRAVPPMPPLAPEQQARVVADMHRRVRARAELLAVTPDAADLPPPILSRRNRPPGQ